MRSSLFFLTLLFGCEGQQSPARISPAEGQTLVALDQPLFIAGSFVFAEDYPLPDVIQVFELGSDEPVKGDLVYSEEGVHFWPTEIWSRGSTYIWTVREPLPEARQPEFVFPSSAYGSATFSTATTPQLLVGARSPAGDLCAITSQPLTLPVDVQVRVRGEQVPVEGGRVLTASELGETNLPAGDEGLGGFCVPLRGDWDAARVWLGEASILVDGHTNQAPNLLVQDLRRAR